MHYGRYWLAMIAKVMEWLHQRRVELEKAPPSDYRKGALDENRETMEFVADLEWDAGVDDPDF
jgi:tRNA isopentenyl-2-thiomethyl-A-37 hydroxylase MiaE